MNLPPRIRRAWLTLIKHTLNPLTRWLARSSIGPFSLIRHVGRRSGKTYETPLIVAPICGGFMIELTYGHDVDWYKNRAACAIRGRSSATAPRAQTRRHPTRLSNSGWKRSSIRQR
ncbi:MAG: hypothetical protein WCK70_19540 [Chloroflexales bacterium]